MTNCENCGADVPEEQLQEKEGKKVCTNCAAAGGGAPEEAPKEESTEEASEEPKEE